MRHAPKIIASLIMGAGFVWVLRRGGLPLLPDRSCFALVRWWTIPIYLVLSSLSIFLRSYRWVYLLRPIAELPWRRVLGVGLVSFAAILFAPLRMGEMVRPYMIAEKGRITFTQAMGTVAAERIIDGLVLSIILFLGLSFATPLSPLPDHLGNLPLRVRAVPAAAYGVLAVFAAAFASMALFYWRRETARRLVQAVVGRVSPRAAGWLTDTVERVADGLRFLPDIRHSGPFMRDTLAYWGANLLGLWFLLWGCGVHASLWEACVVMGVLSVGILVPAGPGFFGAFQLSIYTALAMFFSEAVVTGPGAAYVFLLYSAQVSLAVVGAAMGFWIDRAELRPSDAHFLVSPLAPREILGPPPPGRAFERAS